MAFDTQLQQGTQPIQRQTAHKIWLSNLNNGRYTQGFKSQESFSPSYVEIGKLQISRVNIVATVVDVFKSEDGNYFSFTLDDGTATIRFKAFNEDTNKLLNIEKGNLVLVIARVREYQGELYLAPEITKILKDPNFELIRKAELLRSFGKPEKLNASLTVAQPSQAVLTTQQDLSHEQLRQKVIDILLQNDEKGAEISTIARSIENTDQATETVMKELVLEGEIYQSKPGFYKAI